MMVTVIFTPLLYVQRVALAIYGVTFVKNGPVLPEPFSLLHHYVFNEPLKSTCGSE